MNPTTAPTSGSAMKRRFVSFIPLGTPTLQLSSGCPSSGADATFEPIARRAPRNLHAVIVEHVEVGVRRGDERLAPTATGSILGRARSSAPSKPLCSGHSPVSESHRKRYRLPWTVRTLRYLRMPTSVFLVSAEQAGSFC